MNFTSYSQIEQAYNQLQFDLALSENTSLFSEMHNYISENIVELPYNEIVFTEAKDGKNFLERIWDFIVGIWNAIKKFFGMIFRAVKQLFTGKSETEKLIEKLENNSEDIADSIQNKPAAEVVKVLTELFVPEKKSEEIKKESVSYLSEANEPIEIRKIFDKLAALTKDKDITWEDLWKNKETRDLIDEIYKLVNNKKFNKYQHSVNEVSFLQRLLLFKLRQNDILLNIIDMIYNEKYYYIGRTDQLYNHFDYDQFEKESFSIAMKYFNKEISNNEADILYSKLEPKKEQLIPRGSSNVESAVHKFLEPYMDSLLSSINKKYNIVSKDIIKQVVEETDLYKAILAKAMLVFSYTKLIILILTRDDRNVIYSFEPRNNVTPSIYDFNYYYYLDKKYGPNIVAPTNVYNAGPSGVKGKFVFKKEKYNSLLKSLKDAHDNILGDISKPLPEIDIQHVKMMFELSIIPLNILNPNIPLSQIEQNTERFSIYRKCKTDIDYYKIMGKGVPKVQVENFNQHFNFEDHKKRMLHYNHFSFKNGQPGPKNETKEDVYFVSRYLTNANGSMRFLLSNTFMYWTKIHNDSLKTLTLYKNKLNYLTINKSILNSIAKICNIKL